MPEPLRVALVDDEPPARRKLARWLGDDPEVEVVAVCSNGYEALDALDRSAPDVLFLDVQMPELSGFGVLAEWRPRPLPLVVFATAFEQYAIDAFREHAADYLLKPYDRERLRETLAHVKARHRDQNTREADDRMGQLLDAIQPTRPYLTRLAVRHPDRVELVRVADVDWVQADGNYVRVHAGGQRHLIRETLTAVAARFDPQQFVRVHRSALVNLDRVAALHPASHGDYTVHLRDGTLVPMSRTYRDRLRDVLEIGF
ncbi:MAG: LytTR family DNA-binding domain-containing protein [Bacteroidota bacterium]